MATAQLVLLTGATGFVGAHVLQQLLKTTTSHVRLVLRDTKKGDHIRSQYPEYADRLSFVEIKDMVAPGAFDDVLDNVQKVIHVASPFVVNAKDNRKEVIEPAINMTRNMLLAAHKASSVQRIVFTGSFASILNPIFGMKRRHTYSEKDWNPVSNIWLASFHGYLSYLASKTLAEKAIWDFIDKEKPRFDVVVLCPPMIYGPLLQEVASPDKLNESAENVYRLFHATSPPSSSFPAFCDVRDVASLHVKALNNEKASNERYLVSGGVVSWQAVCDAAREKYPDWAPKRLPEGKPGSNDLPSPLAQLDTSKVRRDFQYDFRSWQQCLVDDALPQLDKLERKWEKDRADL